MFTLEFVTPEKIVFQGTVNALIVPGKIGSLEILADHAPIIVNLEEGEVRFIDQDKHKHIYKIGGGVLEVKQNQTWLLADFIE